MPTDSAAYEESSDRYLAMGRELARNFMRKQLLAYAAALLAGDRPGLEQAYSHLRWGSRKGMIERKTVRDFVLDVWIARTRPGSIFKTVGQNLTL